MKRQLTVILIIVGQIMALTGCRRINRDGYASIQKG